MTNLLVEAVLVAFCVGGVFGTVVTLHLVHLGKREKTCGDQRSAVLQKMEAHVHTRRFHK